LEVIVRGTRSLDLDAHGLEIDHPCLWNADTAIPIEVSLWSLARPRSATKLTAPAAARASALDAAVLKLDRLTSIAESGSAAAGNLPNATDTINWLIPRIRELAAARQRVENSSVAAGNAELSLAIVHPDEDPANQALAHCQAWITRAEALIGAANGAAANQFAALSAISTEPAAVASPPELETTCFITHEAGDKLRVEVEPEGLTSDQARAGLVALIVATAGIAYRVARSPRDETGK
jgi:hypothetical protein